MLLWDEHPHHINYQLMQKRWMWTDTSNQVPPFLADFTSSYMVLSPNTTAICGHCSSHCHPDSVSGNNLATNSTKVSLVIIFPFQNMQFWGIPSQIYHDVHPYSYSKLGYLGLADKNLNLRKMHGVVSLKRPISTFPKGLNYLPMSKSWATDGWWSMGSQATWPPVHLGPQHLPSFVAASHVQGLMHQGGKQTATVFKRSRV
jgi:hypothetical protein